MTSTLHSEPVSVVLQRLLSAEEEHDPQAFAETGVDGFPAHLSAGQRAELFKDVYMSVSSEGGALLYLLAATGARTVVEYGTSFGVSTIHLASAVRDNGGGTVIGTELQHDKAVAAQRNFVEAGVSDLIDLVSATPWPPDRRTRTGRPAVLGRLAGFGAAGAAPARTLTASGSLILVDDVDMDWGSDVHGPLLADLGDPENGYVSVKLRWGRRPGLHPARLT